MSILDDLSDIGDNYAFSGGHAGYRGGLHRSRVKRRRQVRSWPRSNRTECQDLQGQWRQEVAMVVPSMQQAEKEE